MAGRDNDWTALILGGVATVLGWQTSRITEDIRSTRSVAYWTEESIDAKGNSSELLIIENVSKDKMLAKIKFAIRCKKSAECIQRGTAVMKTYAPTMTAETVLVENPPVDQLQPPETASPAIKSINIETTIASGGRVGVRYEVVKNGESPEFFFVPDPEKALDILVFEGNTVRGFVVRKYFEIMFVSFLVTIVTLVASLVFMIGKNSVTRRRVPPKSPSRIRKN